VTFTPIPPATQTAVAIQATAEARSQAIAATATANAANILATRQAKADQATATMVAYSEAVAKLAEYMPLNLKELKDYADNHAGEKVFVSGRVFNIVPGESNAFQIFVAGTYDAILVQTLEPFSDLYEDDSVTVYGTVKGQYCFNNSQGNEVCQPNLYDAFYYKGQTPEMQAARSTAQVVAAQATRDAQNEQATAQAEQRATVQARIADYQSIQIRELITYPDKHKGEKVRVPGRVFNVLGSDGVIQMYGTGTSDAIYVKMESSFSDLYDGDSITVYGVIGGRECFTNKAGGEVCQPLIEDAFYAKGGQ
jgi:uncharacterized membrane protein YcgQ (UPF0703/DUF1980 family)